MIKCNESSYEIFPKVESLYVTALLQIDENISSLVTVKLIRVPNLECVVDIENKNNSKIHAKVISDK